MHTRHWHPHSCQKLAGSGRENLVTLSSSGLCEWSCCLELLLCNILILDQPPFWCCLRVLIVGKLNWNRLIVQPTNDSAPDCHSILVQDAAAAAENRIERYSKGKIGFQRRRGGRTHNIMQRANQIDIRFMVDAKWNWAELVYHVMLCPCGRSISICWYGCAQK